MCRSAKLLKQEKRRFDAWSRNWSGACAELEIEIEEEVVHISVCVCVCALRVRVCSVHVVIRLECAVMFQYCILSARSVLFHSANWRSFTCRDNSKQKPHESDAAVKESQCLVLLSVIVSVQSRRESIRINRVSMRGTMSTPSYVDGFCYYMLATCVCVRV